MIDITPLPQVGFCIIKKYTQTSFVLRDGRIFERNIFLCGSEAMEISVNYDEFSLSILPSMPPVDLLIIGSGRFIRPVGKIFQQITSRIEIMDTGAACRTYNILVFEGRKVGGFFFLFDEPSLQK